MKNFVLGIFFTTILIFFYSVLEAEEKKKKWASFTVELKKSIFIENNVDLEFLFKNLSQQDDTFSSITQLEARSSEGDRGELNFLETDCDGSIPPLGFFKCKVKFTFPSNVNDIFVKVGAGILADAVFFKIKKNSEWIESSYDKI